MHGSMSMMRTEQQQWGHTLPRCQRQHVLSPPVIKLETGSAETEVLRARAVVKVVQVNSQVYTCKCTLASVKCTLASVKCTLASVTLRSLNYEVCTYKCVFTSKFQLRSVNYVKFELQSCSNLEVLQDLVLDARACRRWCLCTCTCTRSLRRALT